MGDSRAASDLAQRECPILLFRDERNRRFDQSVAKIAMVVWRGRPVQIFHEYTKLE
jgi:hypothetical protein